MHVGSACKHDCLDGLYTKSTYLQGYTADEKAVVIVLSTKGDRLTPPKSKLACLVLLNLRGQPVLGVGKRGKDYYFRPRV